MIPKDMSIGARLFCYKYVLSVYLLCVPSPSSAEAGDSRTMGRGGVGIGVGVGVGVGRVFRVTAETAVCAGKPDSSTHPGGLCPSIHARPCSDQAWRGYRQVGPSQERWAEHVDC